MRPFRCPGSSTKPVERERPDGYASRVLIDFKKLMTVRFLFSFAVQMQAVVLGWRMYDLTRDPLFLGMIGLAEAVPAIGLALFAGYVVDRSRPLVVLGATLWLSFLSGAVMLLAPLPGLGLTSRQQVVALFLASFMTGLGRGFSQPAVYAAVPRLVPRDLLSKAAVWMSSALQVSRISGPALGGIIFGLTGVVVSSAVVCATLLASILTLRTIRAKIEPPPRPAQRDHLTKELLSGVSFVRRHPILFPALTLDMVSVMFGGVTALLPIYASEILLVGPKGLGFLRGAPAIGAALMSFALIKVDIREKAGRHLFIGVAGFGFSILAFALSKDFTLSMAALGLSGAFDSLSMIVRSSAVQLASPDNMRGRISSVNSIFIGSSNEIGEVESGIAARLMGTIPATVFGATVCLATVAAAAVLAPALRTLDLRRLEEEQVNA